jgi:integrase
VALTAKKIGRLVAKQEIGRHHDRHGLYLQLASAGAASWIYRFQVDKRERMLGLGPLWAVSLKQAREKARRAKQDLLAGVDPVDARKSAKAAKALEAAKAVTFEEHARAHFNNIQAKWRNAQHAHEWLRSLERYAFPVLGRLSVAAVDTGLVLRVIEPLWPRIPETAQRVRQRIEAVLDSATVRNLRAGDNPARWGGHLEHLLPARNGTSVKHHAALPYTALPDFMAELRQRDGVAERALEFAILTAARTGEVLGARWSEIGDLRAAVWIVPGERMKGGQQHRVPLSPAAVALLESLPGDRSPDSFVFARPDGRPLVRGALQWALAGLRDGVTVHGFRSTFRDWSAERTAFSYAARELALAHIVHSEQSRAYERTDLLDERRRLMGAWARFCYSPPTAGELVDANKLESLRKAARP